MKELSALRFEQELRSRKEEVERKLLEADNLRKTEELEEARKLQLSMLPKSVPVVPGLKIASYMKTATEVGGDYYDYFVGEDGTLTVAIGDATGHGVKAGTMVAAAKSLFQTLAEMPDITQIFSRMSKSLKRMNLGNIYMALSIVKIHSGTMQLSAAGMPPALLYQSETGNVREILMKGMPLGSISRNRPPEGRGLYRERGRKHNEAKQEP